MHTVNLAWTLTSIPVSETEFLLAAGNAAYEVLRESDGRRQRDMIVAHVRQFLDATVVRGYDLSPDDGASVAGDAELPAVAREMEAQLFAERWSVGSR